MSVEFENSVFYPYLKYETMLVKVLEHVMRDEEGWISYWLYELDLGTEYILLIGIIIQR